MIQERVDQTKEVGTKGRVAILIDGENISPELAGQIIMKSLALGTLVIKRVYGNATKMPKWDIAPGFKLVHSGSGKNATDLLLAIEAVAFSHEASVDTFVVASSDRDFTHLAHHLREKTFRVIGMGEAKSHECFRKACSAFVELAVPEHRKGEDPHPKLGMAATPALNTLDRHLADLIAGEGTKDGFLISSLGGRMHSRHKIKITDLPEKTWRAYLLARPSRYQCDPKGANARVRLVSP